MAEESTDTEILRRQTDRKRETERRERERKKRKKEGKKLKSFVIETAKRFSVLSQI